MAALLALAAVVVLSLTTDSLVIIFALNRVVQIQHQVCTQITDIRLWESDAAHTANQIPELKNSGTHFPGPVLPPPPGWCR